MNAAASVVQVAQFESGFYREGQGLHFQRQQVPIPADQHQAFFALREHHVEGAVAWLGHPGADVMFLEDGSRQGRANLFGPAAQAGLDEIIGERQPRDRCQAA